jgi:hypothetical protein
VALFGLRVSEAGSLFRNQLLRLLPSGPGDPRLPFNAFTKVCWRVHFAMLSIQFCKNTWQLSPLQGDLVLLSRGDPSDSSIEALLFDSSARWLRVAVPDLNASSVQVCLAVLCLAQSIAAERLL